MTEIKKVLEDSFKNLPSLEVLEETIEKIIGKAIPLEYKDFLRQLCENPEETMAQYGIDIDSLVNDIVAQFPTEGMPTDPQDMLACAGVMGCEGGERVVDEATQKYFDWIQSHGMNTVSAAAIELRNGHKWGLKPSNAAMAISKQEAYHALRLIHGIATPPMWYSPWHNDWNSNEGPDIRSRLMEFVTIEEIQEDGGEGTKWFLDYALEHWYELVEEDGKVIEVRFREDHPPALRL